MTVPKSPTGIAGLDEITMGGLPGNRATLVCGGPGCGKTLLSVTYLIHGAEYHGSPGVYVAFEQTTEELLEDYSRAPFDLASRVEANDLALVELNLVSMEVAEVGDYDLNGLFAQIDAAIKRIGARRIVLDSVDSLFAGLKRQDVVRAEFSRLLRWLKAKGLTVVVTGERGESSLTRHGLEEYVADCVIFLDNRVEEQISTRRLRIIKYRGSAHGDNEFPFVIDEHGLSVLPVTSLGLDYSVSDERISTGILDLDEMLGGRGVYRASTILMSGSAGTGKSSMAAHFAMGSCDRSERCLYYAMEEALSQIERNMASIGIHLKQARQSGLLEIIANRPTLQGLETHLIDIQRRMEEFKPDLIIIDPVSSMTVIGSHIQVRAMLTRLINFMKMKNITVVLTSLTGTEDPDDTSEVGISSLIDTWMVLTNANKNGRQVRSLQIIKSRGMAHVDDRMLLTFTREGLRLERYSLPPTDSSGSGEHHES